MRFVQSPGNGATTATTTMSSARRLLRGRGCGGGYLVVYFSELTYVCARGVSA